jgi:hypothetical protein
MNYSLAESQFTENLRGRDPSAASGVARRFGRFAAVAARPYCKKCARW